MNNLGPGSLEGLFASGSFELASVSAHLSPLGPGWGAAVPRHPRLSSYTVVALTTSHVNSATTRPTRSVRQNASRISSATSSARR
jgi:hypothetical protein